jgi:hypothetical protein
MRNIIYFLGVLLAICSCTKLEDPVLGLTNRLVISTIDPVTKVGADSAFAGGNITKDGGEAIIERGVVWSTSPNPTTSLKDRRKSGSGVGSFTVEIDTLLPFTDYYVKAYAINYYGTVYGQQVPFKTIKGVPRFNASNLVTKDAYSIRVSAFVSLDGGEPVTSRGFCISKTTNPTLLTSTIVSVGKGTLNYEYLFQNLQPKTNYFIRPYATNSLGTAYGKQIEVTTEVGAVKIDPVQILNVGASGARLSANISSAEGGTVSRRGFVISKTPEPFLYNATVLEGGKGTGPYSYDVSGLELGTTYYVKAFGINESSANSGVTHTNQVSFTTLGKPGVMNIGANNVSYYSFTVNARVTGDGGNQLTEQGFYLSSNPNPTINARIVRLGGGLGDFQTTYAGLEAGQVYYFTAYATNAFGTSVAANPVRVVTLVNTAPVVNNAPSVGTITNRLLPISGQVDSDGGLPILERGFYYSRSNSSPGSSDIKVFETGSFAQGGFSNSIPNLVFGNVTYYVRTYARNAFGTTLGPVTTFRTPAIVAPTVRNSNVTLLGSRSATVNGVIDSDGYGTISSTGFLWATNSSMSGASSIGGSGNPNFLASITGLMPNTTYWYQSFAKSENNTLTSTLPSPSSFITPCEPGVVSYSSSSRTISSLSIAYNLTDLGGASTVSRGICVSRSAANSDPRIGGSGVTTLAASDASGTGVFSITFTGLTRGTTYSVQSYVINCYGTRYSGVTSLTTSP